MTLFLDEVRSNADKGRLIGVYFVDLKKAFDNISHAKLQRKLPKYGIYDRELAWFTDYLLNSKAIVQYSQEQSEILSVSCLKFLKALFLVDYNF